MAASNLRTISCTLIALLMASSRGHSFFLKNEDVVPSENTMYLDIGCSERESLLSKLMDEANKCPDCEENKIRDFSPNELEQLRIELWKNQILQRLHLDKPPCPSSSTDPADHSASPSVLVATGMMDSNVVEPDSKMTDSNSRAGSIVLFPTNKVFTCTQSGVSPCSLFEFELNKPVEPGNHLSLEVWLFKKFPGNLTSSFLVDSWPLQMAEVDADKESTRKDIEEDIPAWRKFSLEISGSVISDSSTIVIEVSGAPVSQEGDEKPFLLLNSKSQKHKANLRGKRSLDCVEGSTNCCRESHTISFKDMGWDNWIVHPVEFKANYCRGKCIMDFTNTRYHHTTIFYSYFKMNKTAAESLGFSVCCSPSQMSPLTMLYKDNNGTLYYDVMKNMIVESCDCA